MYLIIIYVIIKNKQHTKTRHITKCIIAKFTIAKCARFVRENFGLKNFFFKKKKKKSLFPSIY